MFGRELAGLWGVSIHTHIRLPLIQVTGAAVGWQIVEVIAIFGVGTADGAKSDSGAASSGSLF